MSEPVRFERAGTEEDLPIVVVVQEDDGGWTPGPCASIESGNLIELDVDELAWLVEDAGPKALEALREMVT